MQVLSVLGVDKKIISGQFWGLLKEVLKQISGKWGPDSRFVVEANTKSY